MQAVRAAASPASVAIRRILSIGLGVCALALSSCASAPPDPAAFLARYDIKDPKPTSYSVCHGNGCRLSTPIILTTQEWDKVRAVFEPPPRDAAEERARIAKAVGVLETLSGIRAGTFDDTAGTFPGGGSASQMDCVDEAVNTTTALAMMIGDGLVTRHDLRGPDSRGHFVSGWPHVTAVIVDKDTGQAFAVDSWFFDNGRPATVVPLDVWKDGYRPPGGADG
jgi:hypothetical protein